MGQPRSLSRRSAAWLVAAGLVWLPSAAADGLRVGWAEADITPGRPVALAGQMRTRISRRVRDPVTCTVLVLDTGTAAAGGDQAVLVSLDLLKISPLLVADLESLHGRITAACPGLDPAKIILNATHTHTAPATDGDDTAPPDAMPVPDYRRFVADKIAAAVIDAWNGRAAARVGWALGHAVIAHDRRVVMLDTATGLPATGRTRMDGATDGDDFDSLEGQVDSGMPLVLFWSPTGALSGVLLNLACPAQETEQLDEISADFWHETRQELRRLLGPGVFVLPQCAAAGAATSRPLWRQAAEEEMRRRRGLSSREEIARRIAAAVADVIPHAAESAVDDLVLAHVTKTLELPPRLVTAEERDRCLAEALTVPPERAGKARWLRRTAERFDRQQAALARGESLAVPLRVHAVRLGDVGLVTNSFELFTEYGIRIQARSPAILTCVVQLADGGPAGGYVPTARAVQGGGYSATVESNPVGPEGGRMLVDESVALLESLWPAAGK